MIPLRKESSGSPNTPQEVEQGIILMPPLFLLMMFNPQKVKNMVTSIPILAAVVAIMNAAIALSKSPLNTTMVNFSFSAMTISYKIDSYIKVIFYPCSPGVIVPLFSVDLSGKADKMDAFLPRHKKDSIFHLLSIPCLVSYRFSWLHNLR